MAEDFQHYYTNLNGIRMHYVMEGSGKDTIILCHGWPDMWYGWRKQIKVLSKKGFRVVAPDMRGFGETSAPEGHENYSMKMITQDICCLLDELKVDRVILIGHDWGGEVVWKMKLYHPDRVKAIASLCTPYTPVHDEFIPLEQIVKILPAFAYQQYLIGPKAAKEFEKDVEKFFLCMMRSSREDERIAGFSTKNGESFLETIPKPKRSILLTQEDLDYYVAQYKKSGFQGGLNWYKTRQINWENEKNFEKKLNVPSLIVTAGKDFVLLPAMTHSMEKFITGLSRAHVEEASHWVQVEQHEQVNKILSDWLDKISSPSKL